MKSAIALAFVLSLTTVACGGPGGKAAEREETASPPDEAEVKSSLDDQGTGRKWLLLELTTEQREELERQRQRNRGSGRPDVTVAFTPEQLEAIRRVCPACEETSITRHTDRVGVRVKLYFDEAGRILRPPEPFPYVSR
jgi:hypothetical protein